MSRFIDISGKVYGRLVVLRLHNERGKHDETLWICQCQCGNTTVLGKTALGHTKSCGCFKKTQGGHSRKHRLWKRWQTMIARCHDDKDPKFYLYGARGITVCDRWKHFPNFIEDLNATFFPGATIDRRDGDKGYSPDNCRWATSLEQNNNKRTNRLLTFDGITMTMSQWARSIGAPYVALRARIGSGWSVERALSEPFRKFPRK
jgi:hypothetical protein